MVISNTIPRKLLKGLTVGSLWMYILAVLEMKPSYPYEVRKLIREEFGFEPPIVTLYTTFYRLERDGLIRKEAGVYRVSSRGRDLLNEAIGVLRRIAGRLEEISKSS